MSFDTLKAVQGANPLIVVGIYPNCCKYTTDAALDKRDISVVTAIDASYTGNVTVTTYGANLGDPVFFTNANPYLLMDGELVKISIVDATTINITARAQLGTTASSHSAYTWAVIKHSGEADGSCYGYPRLPNGKGCSTGDSFDRDAERELLFPSQQLTDGSKYLNGFKSASHRAGIVAPGESTGKRSGYNVSIADTVDNDWLTVPYADRRTSNGTLFGKLLARHPFMKNRRLVVWTGFAANGQFDRNQCLAREYYIDSVRLNDGTFSLQAYDPLILTEGSKIKYPAVSSGRLLNAINDASTTIELKDFLVGEYGDDTDAVTVQVDNELIDCTVTNKTTGVLAIVTRAVGGSTKKDHSVNATVQYIAVLTDFNPVQLIVDLWQKSSIPAKFFDTYISAIAAVENGTGPVYWRPLEIDKRVNEIIKAWSKNGLVVYYDEVAQKLRIKASSDFSQQPLSLSYETDIYRESLSIDPKSGEQYTRQTIGFAPFDSSKSTNAENASIVYTSINLDTELTGTLEPNEAKAFYTDLLTNSDTDVAIAVASAAQTVNVNKDIPEQWTFEIDWSRYGSFGGGFIEEGELISVVSDRNQGTDGLPESRNLQILSLQDLPAVQRYKVTARRYQDVISASDFDFVIDSDKTDYDLSTEFAPTAGHYKIFIASGVTIGATSTANPAFTTGTQASGVTFEFVHRGSILGAGGNGGAGADVFVVNIADIPQAKYLDGTSGSAGGNAIELTVPCSIDTTQGVIYSGGGGAAGNGSFANNSTLNASAGNGGGGGQGFVGGSGAQRGSAEIDGEFIIYGEDGKDGSRSAAGELAGVSGGAWGDSGDDQSGSAGGQAGYAIKSNGNAVTIVGDNALTIKGRRDF